MPDRGNDASGIGGFMNREHVRVPVGGGEGSGSLLYQLYLIAGSLILAGTALGSYLHPVFYSLPATAG